MPHIRIDMNEARRAQLGAISDALHRSLVDGLGMEADDLFQKFNLHGPDELVFSRTFPDADRDEIIYVEVLSSFGYSKLQKDAMFAHMARNMAEIGIRQDTLLISIIEMNGSENWSSPANA
ncbi:tautomerase family protein (plasmid) [Coraliomargarita sp. W4R53]